jgi:restriction system protein
MAGSGDGTDPGAAVEQLRRQVERLGTRLNELEKLELPALSRKVSEYERKWANDNKGQEEARRQTKQVLKRIADLDAVLASALAARPLAFGDLRAGQGTPAPDQASYQAPRKLKHRLLPRGAKRYERDQQDAQRRYERDYDDYEQQVQQAEQQNAYVEKQEAAFADGDGAAVEWFTGKVLRHSDYPAGVPRDYRISYQPGPAAVAVVLELPPPQSVPQEDGFMHQPDGVCPVRRPEAAVRQQYKRLIACVALRAVHEIFSATSPYPAVVREVTLSGWCTGREEAAGESRTVQLVTLTAERGPFTRLNLRELQPVECLTLTLGGQMSPYPFGLVPVEHADPPR